MIINPLRRTMRSICGHGGANRSAGEVRASAPIRVLVAVIAALLAVQFMPVAAYADSINAQIISGPSAVPFADMYGASIAAPDRYTAAAVLLGHSPEDISSWDDDIKAKLSNQQTGGRFYYFAENSVQNYFDATEHTGIFKTFLDFVGGTFWNIAQTLYGNNLWAALYTSDEYAAAASDLSAILAGENIGGGGGSDIPDTTDDWNIVKGGTVTGNVYQLVRFRPISALDGNPYPQDVLNIDLSQISTNIANDTSAGMHVSVMAYPWSTVPRAMCSVAMLPDGVYPVNKDDNKRLYIYNSTDEAKTIKVYSAQNHYSSNSLSLIPDTNTLNFVNNYNGDIVIQPKSTASNSDYLWCQAMEHNQCSFIYFDGSSSGGGTPVVPPTNWPEEPEAPEPPELPEPGTNPTVTPTPWAPVISPTFDFDLNITTEPTSNDLIDWVKKIYFELRTFHSDEQDWFDEVGKGMDALVDAIDDAQEQIYGELQTIDETLRSEGQKIRDYMYQMFHWLKDQLNFQNDPFDDNNIVYWLKRIWSKLGDGDVNVRPVDPTVDPPAWWEWLNRMLDSLLDGLVGVFNELLGGTGDLLEEVIHQFPFSIPWDIAAFLTALAAPPVTPVFDIVIPAVNGWWSQITFHIDLTPYNTAAATVRLMTKLVFAGLLAWKSRELLNMMDVTKW